MVSSYHFATGSLIFVPFIFLVIFTSSSMAALFKPQPLVLKYHNGTLLKGNVTVNLIWYGNFASNQRSVIVDFIQSLSYSKLQTPPSVYTWWKTTENYTGSSGGGAPILSVGKQINETSYSLGKPLNNSQIMSLAVLGGGSGSQAINVVLTAKDVTVEGFCMNRCGSHGGFNSTLLYAWVGNPEVQCSGLCAWPFNRTEIGPKSPPLVAPNGDVGVDGMVINLATVLAGTVTNPFNKGYFQGQSEVPLEAVSACTGMFGSGAYPGYAGNVSIDNSTGASYNAHGLNGRKYLLPAMWDPRTSKCSTLV